MEVKPPVAIAAILVVIILAFFGFKWYDKRHNAASEAPPLSRSNYMPPPGARPGG